MMKTLTANTTDGFFENIPARLSTIQVLLSDMQHGCFLILDDTNTQNYIQAIPDDKGDFTVEVRYYFSDDEHDFKHYRKICSDILVVFDCFEHFLNEKPINTSDWQDISQDFQHKIYVQSNINQKNFDYYVLLYDHTYEYIMEQIGKFNHTQDFLTIYPDDENSEQSLTIRPQNHDYKITLNHQQYTSQKLIGDTDHLTKIIINFLNNNMSDWAN